jgi:HAD superfamily hydrolase (TIGR01490 family)
MTRPPRVFAFFDVDDTLVTVKTMFSFQDFYFQHIGLLPSVIGRLRATRFRTRLRRLRRDRVPREELNRWYYLTFRGRRPERVEAAAAQWYAQADVAYVPQALTALREQQAAGVEVVFVSGSMVEIVRPIADALGVRHILATRVVVVDGRYTGEIVPPQTIGAGKAQAVRSFLAAQGGDPRACWAYGDDVSDAAMLAEVGHPVVVSREPTMVSLARGRGWRLLLDETGGGAA